jgi:hypothetical protein
LTLILSARASPTLSSDGTQPVLTIQNSTALIAKQISSLACPTCGVSAGKRCILANRSSALIPACKPRLAAFGAMERKSHCHSQFGGLPAANDAKSVFGTLNRTMPQSMQVTSFGNTSNPGLSIFARPPRWSTISEANSVSFVDPHNKHAMLPPQFYPPCWVTSMPSRVQIVESKELLAVQYCTPSCCGNSR